jgi:hypothetical protein
MTYEEYLAQQKHLGDGAVQALKDNEDAKAYRQKLEVEGGSPELKATVDEVVKVTQKEHDDFRAQQKDLQDKNPEHDATQKAEAAKENALGDMVAGGVAGGIKAADSAAGYVTGWSAQRAGIELPSAADVRQFADSVSPGTLNAIGKAAAPVLEPVQDAIKEAKTAAGEVKDAAGKFVDETKSAAHQAATDVRQGVADSLREVAHAIAPAIELQPPPPPPPPPPPANDNTKQI